MDNKITLPKFATLMAEKSGFSKRRCEDFLREFFQTLSRNLENGEDVTVKGFGSFRLSTVEPRKSIDVSTGEPIEIPGHVKVVFTPAKEIADAVNAPFEFFEAVEASDLLTDDEVASSSVTIPENDKEASTEEEQETLMSEDTDPGIGDDIDTEPDNKPEITIGSSVAEHSETISEYDLEPAVEVAVPEEQTESIQDALPDKEPEMEEVNEEKEPMNEEKEPEKEERDNVVRFNESEVIPEPENKVKPHRFSLGFVWGFVTGVIVLAAGLFIGYKIIENKLTQDMTQTKMKVTASANIPYDTVSQDSITGNGADRSSGATADPEGDDAGPADIQAESVATKASDEPQYDTISKTRYLTTMAKEYYGNYNLWPYIYEENHDILGHPDRIRPGTRVRIPDLKMYGVDPKNPEDIRRAKQKGVEIYKRYK